MYQHRLGELTRPLLIKASKCISDHIFRVSAVEPLAKHCEEHGEVDGPRCLAHHGVQVIISWIFACMIDKQLYTRSAVL